MHKNSTQDQKSKDQILSEFEEKSEQLLVDMLQIVNHAQRKIDDSAYRKALQAIDKEL
jgi:hypothetical protein